MELGVELPQPFKRYRARICFGPFVSLTMPQGGRKRARKEPKSKATDVCEIVWIGAGVEDFLGCTTYDGAVVTQPGQKTSVTYQPGDNVLVQTAASENV